MRYTKHKALTLIVPTRKCSFLQNTYALIVLGI